MIIPKSQEMSPAEPSEYFPANLTKNPVRGT
jgi:hypothetical protein